MSTVKIANKSAASDNQTRGTANDPAISRLFIPHSLLKGFLQLTQNQVRQGNTN
jgi:hypothetical protein